MTAHFKNVETSELALRVKELEFYAGELRAFEQERARIHSEVICGR